MCRKPGRPRSRPRPPTCSPLSGPALAHLQICREEAKCNQHVLEVFLFGARRMEFIGQRMLDGLEAAQPYEQARQVSGGESRLGRVERLISKNRDTYERLGREFAALWLSESKPYALDWTMRRYTNAVNECEALLGQARGRPPRRSHGPAPAAGRRNRPGRTQTAFPPGHPPAARASTGAGAPWADPTATHRLGLVVRARRPTVSTCRSR